MSKVVGFIVGAALIVVGIATGNPYLIIQGGALIVSNAILLLTQPKQPARQASEMSIQLGEQPRVMLMGETYTAGSLVDGFNYGGKYGTDWECLIIRLADHKCEGLTGFYVNDEYVVYTGNGNYPQFDDHHFELYFRADTSTEPLPDVVLDHAPGWTAADIGGSGCDVVVCYLADKPDAKEPAWPGGRPRFGFVVKGGRCYDPRLDDTVTGGSGPHRIADPDTWEFTDNAAICRYKWVRGVYSNDENTDQSKLLVGRGLTAEEAPPENVIAAANLCDESGSNCLLYEQHDTAMPENSLFEVSPTGQWILHWGYNFTTVLQIEWWHVPSRTLVATSNINLDFTGLISNIAVSDEGRAYFVNPTDDGFGGFDISLYTVEPRGAGSFEVTNSASSQIEVTRVVESSEGRKILTARNVTGYLDGAVLVSTSDYARDFCAAEGEAWMLSQPTGSSADFTLTDLTGSGGATTLTGPVVRASKSTARIRYVPSMGHFFCVMDNKFILVDKATMTITATGNAVWPDSADLGVGTSTSFWSGFSEYSLEDGSLLRSETAGDWVSENVADANIFAVANSAFWSRPDGEDHITIRFLGGGIRYRVAGPIYSNQDWIDVEGMFAAATGGTVVTREGSVELNPGHAESVVATFTDADLLSASQTHWNQGILSESSEEWINTVVARYVEPSQKWQDHAAPVVRDTADIIADGKPREASITLRLVRDQDQALHVAEINRRLGRLWGRASVTLGPRFCEIEDGDWIDWQSYRYFGGDTKTFRVEAYSIDEKWHNTLTLREIEASVYADTCDFDFDQSVAIPNFPPPPIGEPDSSDWTLTAVTLDSAGASVPALEITGAVPDDEPAEAIIFEYWLDDGVADPADDPDAIGWTTWGGHFPPTTTKVDITGLTGGATYYVAVSYIVSGETGDRLVLGPAIVSDYSSGFMALEDDVEPLELEDDLTVYNLG